MSLIDIVFPHHEAATFPIFDGFPITKGSDKPSPVSFYLVRLHAHDVKFRFLNAEHSGDSYTTTTFNSSSIQPSLGNPMGNPDLGQGTSTDGINWVGFASSIFNTSVVLSYNMAHYGATVNESIVKNESKDFVYQVKDFRSHYGPATVGSLTWTPDSSVFAIWFGVNDVQLSYNGSNPNSTMQRALESYSRLVHELHDYGARRFLIINVPPITRTPAMLLNGRSLRQQNEEAVLQFNRQLAKNVGNWRRDLSSANIDIYDSWTFMTKILDQYWKYGFYNDHCIGYECIWFDHFHPTSAFHRLLAGDIQKMLDKKFDVPHSAQHAAAGARELL